MMSDPDDADIIHGEFDSMSVAEIVKALSGELDELAQARARIAELEAALKGCEELKAEMAYREWWADLTNRFAAEDPLAFADSSLKVLTPEENALCKRVALMMLNYRSQDAEEIQRTIREFYAARVLKDSL